MRVKQISLTNIRSYEDEQIDFQEGTTLFKGKNGAGKSTVLHSIFAGLFQSDAVNYINGSSTLDKLVNKNATSGKIELVFSVNNEEYVLRWELRIDTDEERSARTKSCTLESETLSETVSGVTEVQSTIEGLLGLSAEEFVNSVYIQQEDISRLLDAGTDERKTILDGLLGLSQVDRYVDRMETARREVKNQKREASGQLQGVRETLDGKESASELRNSISTLTENIRQKEDEMEAKKETVEKFRKQKIEAENKLKQLRNYKSNVERVKQVINEKENKIENQEEAVSSKKDEVETVKRQIEDIKEKIEQKASYANGVEKIAHIKEKTLDEKEDAEEKIQRLQETVTEKEVELKQIAESLSERRQELEEVTEKERDEGAKLEATRLRREDCLQQLEQLEEKKRQLEEELKVSETPEASTEEALNGAYQQIQRELESVEKESGRVYTLLNQTEELVDGHECPVCGSSEHSGKTEQIENQQEELRDRRIVLEHRKDQLNANRAHIQNALSTLQKIDDVEQEMELQEEKLKNIKQTVSTQNKRLSEIEDEHDRIKEEQSNLEQRQTELQEQKEKLREELHTIEEYESELSEVIEIFDKLDDYKQNKEALRKGVKHKRDIISEKKNSLDDRKQKLQELQTEISNFNQDEAEYEAVVEKGEEEIKKVNSQKSTLESELDALKQTKATREERLSEVEELERRKQELETRKSELLSQVKESTQVIEAYERAKTKARATYIQKLNEYANDVFEALYQKQDYQKIRINMDYRITLVQSDKTEVEPELSSGGEGAILNLALRAGMYKLVTEQSRDTSLPPFILDEPTTYLDSEHVNELRSMITEISNWNVPQIFVVSHDESLIDAADTIYAVEKSLQGVSTVQLVEKS